MNLRFVLKNYQHWTRRLIHRGSGGRVTVGDGTYGAPKIRWWGEPADLVIGKYCSIADDVEIFLGGNHRTDWISTYPFSVFSNWGEARTIAGHPSTKGTVTIGNDVWLGAGCVILSGVTIGHGAVVGCRSVVTKDIPDYAIVAGNPAEVVRMRFPPAQVDQLLTCSWWNWEPSLIRKHVRRILSADVERFLDTCRETPGAYDGKP